MNSDWLLKHFDQINGAPRSVSDLWRFYLEYYDRLAQIPQMPSGELVAAFLLKKRLMEWAEAALQSESGGR
jgi:hypothetical protein